METIMTPKFMHRFSKIITEVSAITGIDEVDAKALEELLEAALNEYCLELDEYYAEEHSNALDNARIIAYDEGTYDGYADGYDVGYDVGYADGSSESH